MARDPAKMAEKMDDPRVQARAAMEGALPQRLAYVRLFGSQYVLSEERTRRASRPSSTGDGIPRRISFRFLLGRQVLTPGV